MTTAGQEPAVSNDELICDCQSGDPLSVIIERCPAPYQLRGDMYVVFCRWCGRAAPFINSAYPDSATVNAAARKAWNALTAALSAERATGGEVIARITRFIDGSGMDSTSIGMEPAAYRLPIGTHSLYTHAQPAVPEGWVMVPRDELDALLSVAKESTYGSDLGREGRAKVALANITASLASPSPPSPAQAWKVGDGVALIASERRRQIESEGWTPSHDDEHALNELATAAACYAAPDTCGYVDDGGTRPRMAILAHWPWSSHWWKPGGRLRELAKAGALIAAEIDRLQRAAATHHADRFTAITGEGDE